ncbi:MAG: 5'-methylthioadenosine/adenosylhomocysteine nucleosidase [Treponema sp.]|nr:5'-methylthioadenosine/adenosylhomocysteine nucleosidase [Treponema sp.]
MIGIIGAMEIEVKNLVSTMENPNKTETANLVFYTGKLSGKDVTVVQSGVGKINAALCAQILCREFKCDCVINTGIAGAMAEGLGIFDFVVSTAAVHHDVDVKIFGYEFGHVPGLPVRDFPADEKLVAAVERAFAASETCKDHKLVKGLVASGDQFISSGEKKSFIKSNFNAACCEMEGASIAHACYLNKTPFVIVRCMSDMADDAATSTYTFNEETAAGESTELMMNLIKEI